MKLISKVEGYTAVELARLYKLRKLSPVDVAKYYLDRIRQLDGKLNSYIFLLPEEDILSQAKHAEKLIESGEATPLTGVPISVKDNINVLGYPTTCASKILEGYISPYDATVIRKLKEAGVVILGKVNLDEFAMGSSTENSAYGPTRNPFDLNRVPGGSSGGSAASLAADLAVLSLGSDTGGSIRLPAAFCGIYGLKPTYGLVSRYGLVAFASSLDQIGPMAKTLEDLALLLDHIAGFDPMDSTSAKVEESYYPVERTEPRGMRIGYLDFSNLDGVQEEVLEAYERLLRVLEENGAELVSIKLEYLRYAVPTYYIIACSEASSNLARYDGIRYGKRIEGANVRDTIALSRAKGFGREVKRRIVLGTFALSAGYKDRYYLKAQAVRKLITEEFQKVFEKADLMIMPTSPTTAFRLGEKIDDPLKMYLSDIFTISVNLAGIPALSLPYSEDRDGLPIGLQVIGPHFSEREILGLAKWISSNK